MSPEPHRARRATRPLVFEIPDMTDGDSAVTILKTLMVLDNDLEVVVDLARQRVEVRLDGSCAAPPMDEHRLLAALQGCGHAATSLPSGPGSEEALTRAFAACLGASASAGVGTPPARTTPPESPGACHSDEVDRPREARA
jgi:hypothetical protein